MTLNNAKVKEELNKLIRDFSESSKNLNYSKVNAILHQHPTDRFTNKKYRSIIELIVNDTDLSNKDLLIDLFSTPSILTISSYRKFLDHKALTAWELHRFKHSNIYNNLFDRLHKSLTYYGLDKTLENFDGCLKEIANTTNKSYQQVVDIIKNYHNCLEIKDPLLMSTASSTIKSLIKSFNAKAKAKYINNYINKNVEKIKNQFKINIDLNYTTTRKISVNQFLNIVLNDDELRSIFKIFILEKLGYTVDNDELSYIITNILNSQNEKNLEFFNLEENSQIPLLPITKSYNRLKNYYLKPLNELFSIDQLPIINKYLTILDNQEKKALKSYFTSEQMYLLEKMIPIIKEAKATLIIDNNNFEIISDSSILSIDEEKEIKRNEQQLSCYNGLQKLISKFYYSQCKALNNALNENKLKLNLKNIPFTDDSYTLQSNDYLFHFSTLANIIFNIEPEKWKQYSENDTNYKKLKKLLIKDGLLACVLTEQGDIDIIIDIINNLPAVLKTSPNLNTNIEYLSDIVKKTRLSELIDSETISILGNDVANKIAYDVQFLQGTNTPSKIQERLDKAKDLMKRAEIIDKSAIPYFENITVDNVTLERYLNNDPVILTSGIDSNTCFKISANDNDYLFYSILNKNGMVARFVSDGKMIGRITAHRLSNVLLINGVRTAENDYQATSLTKLNRNNTMINTIVVFANKMIELTENSDCPIDFVVSNKAGILESSTYNDTFPILPSHLFENPIDSYNEDFEEFKNTYNNQKQFLQETPYYQGGLKAPFTTDFGHYPVVLIAAREGKSLERKWDITLNSPEAIYQRPNKNNIKQKIKSLY